MVEQSGKEGEGEGRGQQTFAECQGRGKRKEREKKITFTILCLKLCTGWGILRRKGQYNKVLEVKLLQELASVCVFSVTSYCYEQYILYFQALSSLQRQLSPTVRFYIVLYCICFSQARINTSANRRSTSICRKPSIHLPPLLAGAAFLCFCAQAFFLLFAAQNCFQTTLLTGAGQASISPDIITCPFLPALLHF